MHERGGFGHDHRTLGVGLAAPGHEARLGGRELGLQLGVREVIEGLQRLAVIGIDALISHVLVLFTICNGAVISR